MKIKGAPCIHEMLLGAAGGRQPGPLAHSMAIIRAQTQDALQPLSHPSHTCFDEKTVVSVYQQIFYPVKL